MEENIKKAECDIKVSEQITNMVKEQNLPPHVALPSITDAFCKLCWMAGMSSEDFQVFLNEMSAFYSELMQALDDALKAQEEKEKKD